MKNFIYGVLFSIVCILSFYGVRDVLNTYEKADRLEKQYKHLNQEHRELLESLPDEYCNYQPLQQTTEKIVMEKMEIRG